MTVFRSYFSKNNTLIDNNLTNNSQNPVTDITYGTLNESVSRFIFNIDTDDLKQKIISGEINPNNIQKHVLHLTNTIRYAPEFIGKKSYSDDIERASGFELELFNIAEDWDEGNGYDFVFSELRFPKVNEGESNWYYRKTNIPWSVSGGSYVSGLTDIIGTQVFDKGNEDINIDITDYVNGILNVSGLTGYTGTTYGLGIKYTDFYESLINTFRQAVSFHTKYTNTFYEPYVETIIDDQIIDDRNYFYQDKDNNLYLYSNNKNIIVNTVTIYDHEDNIYSILTGDSIVKVKNGIFKISLNIDSDDYPDAIIFRDVWNLTLNNKTKDIENQFYIIKSDNYFNINNSNSIDFDNYYFYFWGIEQNEKLISGDKRKIKITTKELYPDQNNFVPLDIEYRLFTTVGEDYEINIIPFTKVDRIDDKFEFTLDTSWLIPQDYYLQLRLKNGEYYKNKESLTFTIVSDNIK